jgi:hypothetical protein
VIGEQEGASDRRWWAPLGDVWRMKRLVRPHVATVGHRLGSYGMQEVRGSNPRSSTSQFKALNSNSSREVAFLFRVYVRPVRCGALDGKHAGHSACAPFRGSAT